jgi:Tfp pilus assembly protein FimT
MFTSSNRTGIPAADIPTSETELLVSQRPAGQDAGMTAVELVLVLALLGTMLGFAMAKVDVSPWRLNAAATQVNQRLRAARTLAILRQHDVIATFDASHRAIVIHEDANNDGVRDPDERAISHALESGTQFGRGTAPPIAGYSPPISFSEGRITFRRNGSASEEGAVYVARGPDDEHPLVLLVRRATGYTESLKYDGSTWVR